MDQLRRRGNPFRVFVASSLKDNFLKIRGKINDMIQELNADEEIPYNFSLYRFEQDDTNTARNAGSQKEINRKIDVSHAFILLCDNNVGIKTVEEFEHAMLRFKDGRNPAFIAIYRLTANNACNEYQIPFEEFDNRCLTLLREDENGKMVLDKYVYEFTDSVPQMETEQKVGLDQLLEKFKVDMKKWILESPHRPLFNALLGRDVSPGYLYRDESRKANCDERIYFHRHIDELLYDAMGENIYNSILIQGDSLSGKTRALFQAIKSFPDAWFYKFSSDSAKIVDEINSVATYLENTVSDMQIYLIIDDIHMLSNTAGLKSALKRLQGLLSEEVKLVATATTDCDLVHFDTVIKICPMSDDEYYEAQLFCYRNAISTQSGYRNIGAMMIDLNHLKEEYANFLNGKNDEQNISERERTIRRCIMLSIKASSIWHSSNIGDVDTLLGFSRFVAANALKVQINQVADSELYDSLESITKSLRGIVCREMCEVCEDEDDLFGSGNVKNVPKTLQIEEYIYRYILDYNGLVQSGDVPYKRELLAIGYILSYVAETGNESIIVTLSKIARRAAFRANVDNLIYNIVMYCYNREESSIEKYCSEDELKALHLNRGEMPKWYEMLSDELTAIRAEIALNPDLRNDEASLNIEYMSKVLRQKLHAAPTFEKAYNLFVRIPRPLQSPQMLASLIDKCKMGGDSILSQIEDLDIYKENNTSFYIITRMIPFCKDFDEALALVKAGQILYADNRDYIDSSKALLVSERGAENHHELFMKDFNRRWFITAINRLAMKVNSFSQLDELLAIVREYYVLFLDNMRIVERFESHRDTYNRESLTVVDLLARLSIWSVRNIFETIVDWKQVHEIPQEIIDYIDSVLYPELDNTLEKHREILRTVGGGDRVLDDSIVYTPRYKAKNVVNTILNIIIGACEQLDYRSVLTKLFLPMNHTTKDGETLLLRDSFTYAVMLKMQKCNYIDAIELYRQYMKPHSQNNQEHFRISHLILNRIMNKVSTVKEYEYVDSLFDDLGIARDKYTYNHALSVLSYNVCATKIIPQMICNNVELDGYTLGYLVSKSPNISIAAGYFDQYKALRISCEDKKIPSGTNSIYHKKIDELVEQYTKNTPLPQQHYLWAQLFLKSCHSDEDREILWKFLDYLKNDPGRGDLFEREKGTIFNNCIKNTTFIRSYDEAQAFIKQNNVEVRKHTFNHLQKIIINEYGEKGVERLNDLYRQHKDVVAKQIKDRNVDILIHRLRIFRSQDTILKLVFIDCNGAISELECSPLSYVQRLLDLNVYVNEYMIEAVLKIKNNLTADHIRGLVKCVKDNAIYLNHKTIADFGRACKDISALSDDDKLAIYNLPVRDSRYSAGKKIVSFYQLDIIDLRTAFYDVSLHVENTVERLYSYTQLLSNYRRRHGRIETSDIFDNAWDLYLTYVKGKIQPNADILSVLANMACDIVHLRRIVTEFSGYNDVKPNSYLLTSMMRCSNSFDEAKSWVDLYKNLDGQFTQAAVDATLRGISTIAYKKREHKALEYIGNLADYLLRVNTACAYPQTLSAFQCFENYTKGVKVTHFTLKSIFMAWSNGCDARTLNRIPELLKLYYHFDGDSSDESIDEQLLNIAKASKANDADMVNLLLPYPTLLFRYAIDSVKNLSMAIYEKLVDVWQKNFDKLPSKTIANYLANMALRGSDRRKNPDDCDKFRQIVKNLQRGWLSTITTANFSNSVVGGNDCDDQVVVGHNKCRDFNKYVIESWLRGRSGGDISIVTGNDVRDMLMKAYHANILDSKLLSILLYTYEDKLSFGILKSLLQGIEVEDKKHKSVVLDAMVAKIETYGELWYIIDYVCNYPIDNGSAFYAKIIDRILFVRHDDSYLYEISNQLLAAIGRDELSLRDFIRGRLSYHSVVSELIQLDRDKIDFYNLINAIYSNSRELSSERLLEKAQSVVVDYYAHLQDKQSKRINAVIVQELLNIYIYCYNKEDVDDKDDRYLNVIEELLSVDVSKKMDTSIMFSCDAQSLLGKKPEWYIISSHTISRMILSNLKKYSDIKKDDIICKSHSSVCKWIKYTSRNNFDTIYKGVMKFITLKHKDEGVDSVTAGCSDSEEYGDMITLLMNSVRDVKNLQSVINYLSRNNGKFKIDSVALIEAILRVVGKDAKLMKRVWTYNTDNRMRVGLDRKCKQLVSQINWALKKASCEENLKKTIKSWLHVRNNPAESAEVALRLIPMCEACGCDMCKMIVENKELLVNNYWRPDVDFLQQVLGLNVPNVTYINSLLANVDDSEGVIYHRTTNFVNDVNVLYKNLPKWLDVKAIKSNLSRYVDDHKSRFVASTPIDNHLIIAAYIRGSKCHGEILRRIWRESTYNSRFIAIDTQDNVKVFSNSMSAPIFRELSRYIEILKERANTQTRTPKKYDYSATLLLHKLLVSCGIDFVLEDSTLLGDVAKSITTTTEYIGFINDLKTFNLFVSPYTTEALLDAALRLGENSKNKKNKKLLRVVACLRALSEYDSYHQNDDCHDFRAEYFDLMEDSIEDYQSWKMRSLHIPKDSEVLSEIKARPIAQKISDIRQLDLVSLRYLALMRLYEAGDNSLELKEELDRTLYYLLCKLSSSKSCAEIPINDVRKICKAWSGGKIYVPNSLSGKKWGQPRSMNTLYSLVAYFKSQSNNMALGTSYRTMCNFIVSTVDRYCKGAKESNSKYIKVKYSLFIADREKRKQTQNTCGKLSCREADLRKILDPKISS